MSEIKLRKLQSEGKITECRDGMRQKIIWNTNPYTYS